MNVDEATQAAKEYNENFVRQHFPLPSVTYSQRVAITLLAEVERLRAEVQRLDMAGTHSCHDDCQRLPCAQRREIERLRAELAACQNLLDETRTELSICGAFHSLVKEGWQLELEKVNRLEVELAAAKKQFINDCIKHINKVALLNDCEFEGGMIADSVQEYFGDKQCL